MPIIGSWGTIPCKARYIGIWQKLEVLIYDLSGFKLFLALGYMPAIIEPKYSLLAANKLILAGRAG